MGQHEAPMLADLAAETLDISALDSLRELGDEAFVRELVDDFATSMEEYLPSLVDAAARGDAEGASRIAHTIKSSSASMGARRVSEVAARIEQAGRGGALAGMPEAVAALTDEVDEALRRLRDATT